MGYIRRLLEDAISQKSAKGMKIKEQRYKERGRVNRNENCELKRIQENKIPAISS